MAAVEVNSGVLRLDEAGRGQVRERLQTRLLDAGRPREAPLQLQGLKRP